MVVVFKPEIPVEKANSLLFEKGYIFYEGSANYSGDKTGKSDGVKFIVHVPENTGTEFADEIKNIPGVYEVFRPSR